MKRLKKIALVLLALAITSTMFTSCSEKQSESAESGEKSNTIIFGTNAEFPPFEFVTTSGLIDRYDGIDIAIADKIAKDNGMKAEISHMEFNSLLFALENGEVDAVIAAMTITAEKALEVDFSIPYYQATQVMIVKENSTIEKATDLADKKIAVIEGYTGETCISKMGYKYSSFKKGADAILELMNGKADVVVIDSATANKYISDNKGLKIVQDAEAFENEEYGIAVTKGNKELLDKINASIQKMLDDGTISDLAAKYAVVE